MFLCLQNARVQLFYCYIHSAFILGLQVQTNHYNGLYQLLSFLNSHILSIVYHNRKKYYGPSWIFLLYVLVYYSTPQFGPSFFTLNLQQNPLRKGY